MRPANGEVIGQLGDFIAYEGDDCLIWPHAKNEHGYAIVLKDGKNKLVSRIICEAVNGPPPSEKPESLHSCGNGHLGCVNKRHLRWGTHAENMAEMAVHGRSNLGRKFGLQSREHIAKRVSKLIGHARSPETRLRISEGHKRRRENVPAV
jgi:hypothetical protein